MASNKNNNALWKNIREIKKKNNKLFSWVDLFACEIWKCKKNKDGKNVPILNKDGKLPESRIDKLEENLGSSDWDTSSVDSLDEEIQQIKDDIIQLNARTDGINGNSQQQLNEAAQLGRDNQQQLNVIGGQINDLRARATAMEADRDALEARIVAIEQHRSGTGGTGGGKRRKRTRGKSRKKKRTRKRGKSMRKRKRTRSRK